jgi:hypothetical protein
MRIVAGSPRTLGHRLIEPGQHPARLGEEGRARGAELDATGGAVHEPGAEFELEGSEGPRDGRLREAERQGGVGEGSLVGDRDQGPQMTQLDGHAPSVSIGVDCISRRRQSVIA